MSQAMSESNANRIQQPLVSIVVPVFNEEESVGLFVETLLPMFDAADFDIEIVFANDGSRDQTLARILDLAADEARIRVVNLSRNFGKEAALTAGIDHARGDAVIPMDVDLQDPPALIFDFVKHWREGYDMVYGIRADRQSDDFSKRQTANWFYEFFNRMSPLKIPTNAGDFRLLDRRVADAIRGLPERNRFMKGLFAWVGFKSVGVPYERPKRAAGETKFNHWKLWNFALDGVLSFSTVPLRVWTYFGAFVAMIAFAYGCFIITRTLIFGIDLPGYASVFTAVLFLGGIQLLSIGIIGEYIGRMFMEVKGRPLYLVEGVYPQSSHGRASVTPET